MSVHKKLQPIRMSLFYYLYIYLFIFFLSFCLSVYLYLSVVCLSFYRFVLFFLLLIYFRVFFRRIFGFFHRESVTLFRINCFAQFSLNFFLEFFRKQIEAEFCEKSEIVRIFRERTNWDIFGENCKLFAIRFSFFAEKQQS